jgi:hypothetical protein
MSDATQKQLSHDKACELFQLALEHAGREEQALEAQLAAGHVLRDALVSAAADRLERLHQQQAGVMDEAGRLKEQRRRFRQHAAAILGIPTGDVNLSAVVARLLPGQGEALAQRQRRLRDLGGEVERLSQNNAALIYYGLDFLQRFVADLTGEYGASRYSAAGRRQRPARGPFIQLRG